MAQFEKGGRREATESDDGGNRMFHLQENPFKGGPPVWRHHRRFRG